MLSSITEVGYELKKSINSMGTCELVLRSAYLFDWIVLIFDKDVPKFYSETMNSDSGFSPSKDAAQILLESSGSP